MIGTDTDPSSSKQKKPLLLNVALAATFLLGANGIQPDSSSFNPVIVAAQPTSSFTALSQTRSFGSAENADPAAVFIEGTTLQAAAPPHIIRNQTLASVSAGEEQEQASQRRELQKYVVQPGDTVSSIAATFGISVNTILWANELSQNSVLKEGKDLLILPVSGTLHLVGRNETLSGIAATYKADVESIRKFNNLASADEIYQGDLLVIPGGTEPARAVNQTPIANAYFIYPIPSPQRLTQGLHAYNAVDLSTGRCGDPVYAAAGGKIQQTGYHSISGNYVRVLHPNGVVTFYGHLSQILASPGQSVSQGQMIGRIGYTGYTIPAGPSGCHVHFEVRGARNPFAG